MPRPSRVRPGAALAVASVLGFVAPAVAAPPTIQCPPAQTTYESGGVWFYVSASDPDADPVVLSVLNPPARSSFDAASGLFTWVPDYNQAGSYGITFRATAGGQAAECVVPITVGNFNRAPRITCPAPVTGLAGDTLRAVVTARDYDNDPLVFSGVELPAGASISPQGAFAWVTDAQTVPGSYTIQARVSDGGFTVGCSFGVTVERNVFPPRITCPVIPTVFELDPIDFVVGIVDDSGLDVTASAADLPPGATFDGPSRRFQWTPADGQAGTWTPRFTATNGATTPVSCAVSISVVDRGVQPLVHCLEPVSALELVPIAFVITANNPLGGPVTLSATGLPSGATFSPTTGQFAWTPTLDQAGVHDIRFQASNGVATGNCDQRITVIDRAVQPTVTCLAPQSVNERSTISFVVAATNPLDGPLTFSAIGLPPGASLHATTGQFSWTPTLDQSGVHDFRFEASNGVATGGCDQRITVLDQPIAAPIMSCAPASHVVLERRRVDFQVAAQDPLGLPLTFTAQDLPRGATFDPATRLFAWLPGFDQAGTYRPRFIASNGTVAAACTVTVSVVDRAVVPPVVSCPAELFTAERRATSFSASATDPEGDLLTWTVRGLPPGATFISDGRVTWTPDITQAGAWTIEFVSSDGESRDSCRTRIEVADHDAAIDPLEPVIAGVRDVPGDQGGWVEVRLVTAPLDEEGAVLGYNLWRRSGASAAAGEDLLGADAAAAFVTDGDGVPRGTRLPGGIAALREFPPGTWEAVSFTPAIQSFNLRLLAPTRADSGLGGPPLEVYVVSAHRAVLPALWFVSRPDSGHSVDDLAPGAPALRVEAESGGERVRLAWSSSPDLDLAGYEVHRASRPAFEPDEATLLATTADTTAVDSAPEPGTWYRIVALDTHGNRATSGAVASPAGSATPGVMRLTAQPNPSRGAVEFAFDLPQAGAVRLVVLDLRGRVVRVVEQGVRAAGVHRVPWDGRDGAGRRAASGLYVLRLEVGGRALTRKFVRLEE